MGEQLTERARRKARELKRQAEDSAEDMRQRARSAVDEQKEAAVGGIEGVAHALRSASDDLRDRGQPVAAEYSLQVADGLESIANWVSRRNVDDVIGGLEDFARQRPVTFLGGAMVAGFALARFMKSSSARRSRTTGRPISMAARSSAREVRSRQGMRTGHAAICGSGHAAIELWAAAYRRRHLMQHTDDRSLKELFKRSSSRAFRTCFAKRSSWRGPRLRKRSSQAGVGGRVDRGRRYPCACGADRAAAGARHCPHRAWPGAGAGPR